MVDNLTKQKEEMAKFQEAEMLKHLDLKLLFQKQLNLYKLLTLKHTVSTMEL